MNQNQDPWKTEGTISDAEEKEPIKDIDNAQQGDEKTPVLAILSLAFSIIFAPLGLVLSIITLHILKSAGKKKGDKLVISSLIVSICIIVIAIILIILFFVLDLSLIF